MTHFIQDLENSEKKWEEDIQKIDDETKIPVQRNPRKTNNKDSSTSATGTD